MLHLCVPCTFIEEIVNIKILPKVIKPWGEKKEKNFN